MYDATIHVRRHLCGANVPQRPTSRRRGVGPVDCLAFTRHFKEFMLFYRNNSLLL